MLSKLKNLSKTNKIILSIGGVLLIAILLGVIGYNVGKKDVKVNEETIQKVIGEEYVVEIKGEDESTLNLNIVGEPTEEIINDLYELGANLAKDKIFVKFYQNQDSVKDEDKFFTEGLNAEVELNYLINAAKVGTFKKLPEVEKAKVIAEYNGEEINFKNGVVNINLNMALKEETSLEAVAQSKTFMEMFRDLNKDKDISSVQMNINPNDDNGYSYSSEFENVVKEIKTIHY
ncbi:MAG: hypothetical protein GX889_12475 [Clostridiales bacterium]|nr:hypothetical protein [Clostridiales bacterium]